MADLNNFEKGVIALNQYDYCLERAEAKYYLTVYQKDWGNTETLFELKDVESFSEVVEKARRAIIEHEDLVNDSCEHGTHKDAGGCDDCRGEAEIDRYESHMDSIAMDNYPDNHQGMG